MTVLLVALALLCEGAPLDVAIATPAAAHYADVSPVVLAGYVLSEHPGGRWSGSCSSKEACGHYQLVRMWEKRYDNDQAGDQRENAWTAAPIAARVVEYSQGRHADCRGEHNWRAHMKCLPSGRDRCGGSVSRWLAQERTITERLDAWGRWLRFAGLWSWGQGGGDCDHLG